jgi:hypothetical protein
MKIFSFDAETDGLYGPVWAIGAVVTEIQHGGEFPGVAVFRGMVEPTEDVVTDPWVRDHIVPVVNLPKYDTREDLLNAFWEFWIAHKDGAVAIADCGVPVEAGLLRACIELDVENRLWKGPAPLHELATAFLLNGYDPWETDRRKFAGRDDLVQHDPVDDAIAAALCWDKLTAGNPMATADPMASE